MYVLAKFQLHILKAFEVTALQSDSNRKIDLYSKHKENKLQARGPTLFSWRMRLRNHTDFIEISDFNCDFFIS